LEGNLLAKFTICLDPGHGGSDPGARAGGLKESDLTLDIARRARKLLVPKYRIVMTRDDDSTVALQRRVAIAAAAGAGAFVSIHVNTAASALAQGYEAFVRREPSAESLALASAILVQFSKRWPRRRNRGLKEANFVVVKQPRPACLIECFFLSNAAERGMLATPAVRAQLGEAIAWGCGNFASMVHRPPET
jgi:N-acetylmuramoyl-L-alanine amidase